SMRHTIPMFTALAIILSLIVPCSAQAQAPTTAPALTGPFNWMSTSPIIRARPDGQHPINAIKDPSIVYYNGRWHVYATSVTPKGVYSMVYLNFADWKDA